MLLQNILAVQLKCIWYGATRKKNPIWLLVFNRIALDKTVRLFLMYDSVLMNRNMWPNLKGEGFDD